ncbi:MAG: SRPBCC domain-containing protein [Bacteroidetes bacterium]|nr:SRPBCC domain-containing protein [Bacteroidota bacterium]
MEATVQIEVRIPVSTVSIYLGWLDSDEFTAFSGSEAQIDPSQGGWFTLSGGIISGRNVVLLPFRKIVQSWRTTGFPPDFPDSRAELSLIPGGGETLVLVNHTGIPSDLVPEVAAYWHDLLSVRLFRYYTEPSDQPVLSVRKG